MKNYPQVVEEFKSKIFTSEDDIFDYQDTLYEQEFDETFIFYQETLNENAHYGITPNLLYFNTNYSINARAGKSETHYLISINMGTLVHLITTFKNNDNISIISGEEFKLTEGYLDSPINELMYQNAVHFTFYHEMAHLIQNSSQLLLGLYEHSDNSAEFCIENHQLELDADEYSAISLAAHTVQYARNNFGDNPSSGQVVELLVIVCTSALIYILSFPTNKRELYYKELSHPHPVIRITRIINVIVSHCLQTFKQVGIDLEIKVALIVKQTIGLAGKIMNDITGENLTEKYLFYLMTEGENISSYITEFDKLGMDNQLLAVNRWNAYARTLHD